MQQVLQNFLVWVNGHLTLMGSAIISVSTLGMALSGLLKGKADRQAGARRIEEKAKARRYYLLWVLFMALCGGGTFLGTYLTKHAADEGSRAAASIQEQTNVKLEQMDRLYREKTQVILAQLNAAKHEESKQISEEKIRVLRSDFSVWAANFVTNLPAERSKFARLKAEAERKQAEAASKEVDRQKQRSAQCYPVYSFAIKYLQESVRAYAQKTGSTNITMDAIELPENLYNGVVGAIRINPEMPWTVSIRWGAIGLATIAPGSDYDLRQPSLRFVFSQAQLYAFVSKDATKMKLFYKAQLPVPDPETVNGEYSLSDYETPLKDVLQRVITAQLVQTLPAH